jgi:hypothetical protein
MSWLARSIANSLRIDEDDGSSDNDDDDYYHTPTTSATAAAGTTDSNHSPSLRRRFDEDSENEEDLDNLGRGVKEDLSELKETLARQLWGVASFLAPPPQPDLDSAPSHHQTDRLVSDPDGRDSSGQGASGDVSDDEAPGSVGYSGDREGFSTAKGIVNNGISRFSNFFFSRPDDEIADAIGVTEEVLTFAGNIAHHPETWLDFPLEEEEEIDDFEMSDAQCKHAMAVERLAPRLAALRIELCPAHMNEGYFWKVYFVLLHSRLNKHDNELLSTPQILAARAMWMQELHKQTKPEPDWLGRNHTFYSTESANSIYDDFEATSSDSPYGNMSVSQSFFAPATKVADNDKHPVVGSDQMVDKSVIKEETVVKTIDYKELVASSSYKLPVQDYGDDDDGDSWLEENFELDGHNGGTVLLGTDEDVSFSDLEDGDDFAISTKTKTDSAKPS